MHHEMAIMRCLLINNSVFLKLRTIFGGFFSNSSVADSTPFPHFVKDGPGDVLITLITLPHLVHSPVRHYRLMGGIMSGD